MNSDDFGYKGDLIISVMLQTKLYINVIKIILFLCAILFNVHLFNITGSSGLSLVIFTILTALFVYYFTINFERRIVVDNVEITLVVNRNFFGASKISIVTNGELVVQTKTMEKYIYIKTPKNSIDYYFHLSGSKPPVCDVFAVK